MDLQIQWKGFKRFSRSKAETLSWGQAQNELPELSSSLRTYVAQYSDTFVAGNHCLLPS